MPASRGRKVIPLSERPQDYFWIFVFSVFTLTSVLYAPISAFNVRVSADSPHGIIRWMHSIAKETDTIIIDNPPWARFANSVDAFFNSVFQMLLIYCIMTGKDWIRVPYFYYHAFHLYGTVLYTTLAYYGERPVVNIASVIWMNLPYAVLPVLFAVLRLGTAHPFTREIDSKEKKSE